MLSTVDRPSSVGDRSAVAGGLGLTLSFMAVRGREVASGLGGAKSCQ
jgi:hypothetical protein